MHQQKKYYGLFDATLGLLVTTVLGCSLGAQYWVQITTSGAPIPVREQSSAIDLEQANQLLVWGRRASPPRDMILGRLSNANGIGPAVWTSVSAGGTTPAARLGHSAVYDAASDRMITFGGGLGFTSPCSNTVHVLTDASGQSGTPTWTQLSPTGTPPGARMGHDAAYDPVSNRMIVFGGQNCFVTAYDDAWVLTHANGLGGTPAWIGLAPTGGGPGIRQAMSVSYDSGSNRLIVFGGSNATTLNDVWVLSNANGLGGTPAWALLAPTGSPAPRNGHAATYDAATNRLTIFGGSNASGPRNDTWTLTHANGLGGSPVWFQLQPTGGKPPGGYLAAGFGRGDAMLVQGGNSGGPSNETWALTHANGVGYFDRYGWGSPGTGGVTPLLGGRGTPAPGSTVSLDVTAGVGSSVGVMLFGFGIASTPLFGGVLLVSPPSIVAPLSLGGTAGTAGMGSTAMPFSTPTGNLYGVTVYFQTILVDPGAASGLTFTNGLRMVIG